MDNIDQSSYESFNRGVGLVMASTKVVFDSAIQVGFTEEQALMMATAYMTNTFTQARNEVKE